MIKNEGFTLIELLVVVAIIGLLAAIGVPKYADLLEKANLGATIANLSSLRSSVYIYHANYSVLPASIDPEEIADMNEVIQGGLPFVKARYPIGENSPYGNSATTGSDGPVASGKGWFYDPSNGKVCINSIELDVNGSIYSVY